MVSLGEAIDERDDVDDGEEEVEQLELEEHLGQPDLAVEFLHGGALELKGVFIHI